jgi:hypothetical protein
MGIIIRFPRISGDNVNPNLFAWSGTFSNPVWVKTDLTATPTVEIAPPIPDVTVYRTDLTGSVGLMQQTVAVPSGWYSYSIYAHYGEDAPLKYALFRLDLYDDTLSTERSVSTYIDLTTGDILLTQADERIGVDVTPLPPSEYIINTINSGGGWWRVHIAINGLSWVAHALGEIGHDNTFEYFAAAQLEQGEIATAYQETM